MMIGAQDATLGDFVSDTFQAPGTICHRTHVVPFFTWIQMVKDKHVRVIHMTAFPLTLFSFEILIEPLLVSQAVFASAFIITARISFVMLVVNGSFTGATIWLQTIPVANKA